MSFSSVDLPAPLRPTSPTRAFGGRAADALSRMRWPPRRSVMESRVSMGGVIAQEDAPRCDLAPPLDAAEQSTFRRDRLERNVFLGLLCLVGLCLAGRPFALSPLGSGTGTVP